VTAHVQDAFADSVTDQAVIAIDTAAGHTLVVAIAQWVTTDTPVNIVSIADSTAGQNTWYYSTLPASQNPPANGSYDSGQTQWGFAAVACCIGAKAVTEVTVTMSGSGDFLEANVSEFSGLPAGAVVLGGASSGTLRSGVTSYTTPALAAASPSPLLAVVATSFLNGEWTGVTAGYTLLSYSDTLGAYALAAPPGAVSATFTAAAANDVPSSAVLAIGAPQPAAAAAPGALADAIRPGRLFPAVGRG
jgi:hypothetical protein